MKLSTSMSALALATALGIGMSGPIMAQTMDSPDAGTTMDPQSPTGDSNAAAGMNTDSMEASVSPDTIGKDVVNQAGESIGQIEDIVTDESSQDVYAVVSVGGFLGIGAKEVLIPIDQLNVGGESAVLMSQGSEEDLKNMPAYEEGTGYRSMKDTQQDDAATGSSAAPPGAPTGTGQ